MRNDGILATFVDQKPIKTRGQHQFVFEVPEHDANRVLQLLGGLPQSANPVWVGIAPVNPNPQEASSPELESEVDPPRQVPARGRRLLTSYEEATTSPMLEYAINSPARGRRSVAPDKRLVQQAGMLCADPLFHRYLLENNMIRTGAGTLLSDQAATAVRLICGVKTRADIIWGTPAGDAWDALYSKFMAWKHAPETAT